MPRLMAQEPYRNEQQGRRYDPNIRRINELVDELRENSGRGWMPYVAPIYGGEKARLLTLLSDPGPKTQGATGSGFLSMENNDPTAESLANHFAAVGLKAEDALPWNAYPWYINRRPRAAELQAGLLPLQRLLALLPKLRVVMLHGGVAHNSWSRLERQYPMLVSDLRVQVIKTYHPARRAFLHKDPAESENRKQRFYQSFVDAAAYLEADLRGGSRDSNGCLDRSDHRGHF